MRLMHHPIHQPTLRGVVKPPAIDQPMVADVAVRPVEPTIGRRRFLPKLRNKDPVHLTADDTSEVAAAITAPSVTTEASWSICESNNPQDVQSSRVFTDVDSASMAAAAAPASPCTRGGERTTPGLGVICGGRKGRFSHSSTTPPAQRRGADGVHVEPNRDPQCRERPQREWDIPHQHQTEHILVQTPTQRKCYPVSGL